MNRATEEMKNWLFDLAHGNLSQETIVKGFIKHYVINGLTIMNVQDDIHFHTTYELTIDLGEVMKHLRESLEKFSD